jgi:hypothetical protein
MTLFKFTALALLSFVAWTPPAGAAEAGEIFGTVVDQSTGELLERVLVVVQGTELQGLTDSQGRYRIEGIPPGQHTIQVSSIGYRLLKKEISGRKLPQSMTSFTSPLRFSKKWKRPPHPRSISAAPR